MGFNVYRLLILNPMFSLEAAMVIYHSPIVIPVSNQYNIQLQSNFIAKTICNDDRQLMEGQPPFVLFFTIDYVPRGSNYEQAK